MKRIFIALSLGGLLFTACNKIDLTPTDVIDPSKAFRNADDLNMGVLGAYAPVTHTLIEASATVADETMLPSENTVSNTATYRWLYNSSYGSVTSAWNEYYTVIDRANRVLAAIPNVAATSSEQGRLNQYQGEMLALRAYCHFELVRAYASSYEANGMGVPYMKKSILSYPARATVKQNFDDINADLAEAKKLIPDSFKEKIRITRTAVSAIQARVALYEKNWVGAAQFASEVIASESLASSANFGKIWKDESDNEVVWKLARVAGDALLGSAFFRQTGEIVLYAPAFKMVKLFDKSRDIRFKEYITYDQSRFDNSQGKKSAYFIKKYMGSDTRNPGLTAVKLFRTGEMYLIKAEAEAETSGVSTAAATLNALRKARIADYVNENFGSKQSVLDAIYTERYKELAFEGHRFFDLKRRNAAVERNAEDAVNAAGAVKLDPTSAQYCFPIPADEMSVNKAMVQNPKY